MSQFKTAELQHSQNFLDLAKPNKVAQSVIYSFPFVIDVVVCLQSQTPKQVLYRNGLQCK
jgi:hypothetical protein